MKGRGSIYKIKIVVASHRKPVKKLRTLRENEREAREIDDSSAKVRSWEEIGERDMTWFLVFV